MPYGEVGDLSVISALAELEKMCAKARLSIGAGRSASAQLWELVREVKMGHMVVASKAGLILGAGRVTREYYFDSSSDNAFQDNSVLPHRVGVDWAKNFEAGLNTRSVDQRVFRSLFFPQDILHEVVDREARQKIVELIAL